MGSEPIFFTFSQDDLRSAIPINLTYLIRLRGVEGEVIDIWARARQRFIGSILVFQLAARAF